MSSSFAGAGGEIWEPIIREVVPEITAIALEKRFALLAMLMAGMGGVNKSLGSTQIEWQDAALRARTATVVGAVAASAGATTIVVGSGEGVRFRANMTVQSPSEELIQIVSVATDTLTVVRGYSGTTIATIASGATLFVVSTAAIEGAAYVQTSAPAITVRKNFTQIIREDFDITKTNKALTTIDPSRGTFDLHAMTALGEVTENLADVLYYGGVAASTPQGSASIARTMDGIFEICRTGSAASTGGLYTDISGADFNDSATATFNLIEFIRDVYDAGGSVSDVFVSTLIASQLVANRTGARTQFEVVTIGGTTEAIVTPFGTHRLHADLALRSDHIVATNMEKLGLLWLPERAPRIDFDANAGEKEQYIAVAEGTLVVQDGAVGGHAVGFGAAA